MRTPSRWLGTCLMGHLVSFREYFGQSYAPSGELDRRQRLQVERVALPQFFRPVRPVAERVAIPTAPALNDSPVFHPPLQPPPDRRVVRLAVIRRPLGQDFPPGQLSARIGQDLGEDLPVVRQLGGVEVAEGA